MEYLSYLPTLIFSEPQYRNLHSLLVSQQGETVFEGYFNGYDAETLHEVQHAIKMIRTFK
jgi:hypothetical protein